MAAQASLPPEQDQQKSAFLSDKRSKWSWKAVAAVVLAVAVLSAVLFLAVRSSSPGSGFKYVTAAVTRGDLAVVVTATGSIQPTNKVDISSELSGTVRKVLVDYNSVVTAGQALAELDTDKLKATVESSRARLNASRARVKEAEATVVEKERDYQRKKALAARQVSSIHDLEAALAAHERAVAALASARAEVGVADADLRLNETNLSKSRISSPINGLVLKRNVDPGQIVASSLQAPVLFYIAEDLKQMEVWVDVDEADVGHVKEGQSAAFSVDAYPGRKFPATIRQLRFGSEVVQGVVTYKAVLTVDNSELLLRPGMTATAEIAVKTVTNALLTPNAALRFAPPTSAQKRGFLESILPGRLQFRPPSEREAGGVARKLWLLRDGNATEVPVVIGATDGKRTEIVEGNVAPGDKVIIDMAERKK